MSKLPPDTKLAAPADRAKALDFLARRIRALRERLGITQEELASRCGISVSFASLLERGQRSPSYETLLQIAEALEIPLAELFRTPSGPSYDDPYYSRLLDFARRRRLSRSQVDRLVAVGQLVFDEKFEPALLRRVDKPTECSMPSC